MGSDSRVRGADSVSTAAILPGPVQAWPRPDPAQTPPWPRPRRQRRSRSPAARTGLLCNRLDSPAHRAGRGPALGKAPPATPGALRRRRGSPLRLAPQLSQAARPLWGSHVLPFWSLELFAAILVPEFARPGPLSVPKSAWVPLVPQAKFYTWYPRKLAANLALNPFLPWPPNPLLLSVLQPRSP